MVVKRDLEKHFGKVSDLLKSEGILSSNPVLDISWQLNPVVSGIAGGAGCEYIKRNRGRNVFVFPAWELRQDEYAWIGYREEWAIEPAAGKHERLSFKSIGLTVHYGGLGEGNKPQMFRIEWAGFANWSGGSPSFQAKGAGHPHWQFDAMDSTISERRNTEASDLLESIREIDGEQTAQTFLPDANQLQSDRSLYLGSRLSKMHFACSTTWWNKGEAHMHQPRTLNDIVIWLENALQYIGQELKR